MPAPPPLEQPDVSSGPVLMPTLPARMLITTEQQYKACIEPMRARILVLLQHEPLTTKQIADRLQAVPGTISHHMQVLEAAGLVQIVARRIIHGIQAKYYTRAARIFDFEMPRDLTGETDVAIEFLQEARAELAETLATGGDDAILTAGFPHVRLTPERAQYFQERYDALIAEMLAEPLDPAGRVYGVSYAMFLAPPPLQVTNATPDTE